MELPDFARLWEANLTLARLKESLEIEPDADNRRRYDNPHLDGGRGPIRFHTRRPKPQYRSDGICGVNFGIIEPEFANPLATCCQMLFFTQEEYDRHTSEHISCPGLPDVENSSCGQEVHPSVLKIHLEIDHRRKIDETGNVKDKLIKSWRETRAKNYPTFERVQAKIREVGYRMERGQIFLTRKFGSLNKRAPLELHPVPGNIIKRFKTAPENCEISNLPDPGIPDTAAPGESKQIDESEKVFSENEEENEKRNVESDMPASVVETGLDEEDDQESLQNGDYDERRMFDSEAINVDVVEAVREECHKGDSDFSWSEESKDEEIEVANQPDSQSTFSDIKKLPPIVDYGSDVSWSEECTKEDAGDAQLKPHFSPPKGMNLVDQLGFFRPQNTEESNEEKEKTKAHGEEKRGFSENCVHLSRRRQRRKRYSRMRRGRVNCPGTSLRREDNKDGDEEMQKLPTAVEAELDLELDEVSSKGGQKAFANHPVVEMATRRRLCMRRTSTITKRPTLLHMLLAEEIRHERNQLMQCVRYVVNNNFFLPK